MRYKGMFAALGCGLLLGLPAWAMPNGPSLQGVPHTEGPHFITHFPSGPHGNAPLPDGHFCAGATGHRLTCGTRAVGYVIPNVTYI
jgi:hypothetical protein